VDLLLRDRHIASRQVDLELPDGKDRRVWVLCRVGTMTQRRTYARQQLAHPKGLGDVVVGPGVEGSNLVGFSATRRQDDDRHGGPLSQLAGDLQTVQIREPEIEENERRLAHRGLGAAFLCRRCGDHLIAIGLQCDAENTANRSFIFDNQDSGTEVCHTTLNGTPSLRQTQRSLDAERRSPVISSSGATEGGVPVSGSVKRTTGPPPGRVSAHICPPCASTRPRQIVSPKPVPLGMGGRWTR